ncbi:uncharacterized protein BT62DRAFT_915861 [Guyanagaster necrorhizus]|uniref:Uncharacterized protein n=1 Tax=Guyanagaster necrorhizus TaxID=856835 RepID=A0A9P7W4R9_9AGAR|nr:uncharacterized protein BT62DRAFT_915861 [Guyanagaster necrorhizus MCA 3950]KAG7452127.1 hypothetical protein BT62DRAFT_915861 [Guyanagaster necrorhizus MCA 3950]
MIARGRSREVSRAALARRSSEERLSRVHEVNAPQHSERIPGHATSRKSRPKLDIPHQPLVAPAALAPQPLTSMFIRNSEVKQPLAPAEVAPTPIGAEHMPIPSFPPSPSTSPSESMSSQPSSNDRDFCNYFYCDSPPSPPHTIEDQLHVAYAHDDIHLAKILLLKLRGIEVTSDDDPRIAAVQDEDFDECFLPNGMLLLTEEEEQRVKKAQRLEAEKIRIELERRALRERERKHEIWEKRCEKIWENEKLRLREEKARIKLARRKQEEQRKARQQELESHRPVTLSRSRKPKLSYNSLSQSRVSSASSASKTSPSGYAYSFVVTPALQIPPSRHRKMKAASSRPSTSKARREYPAYTSDYSTDTASDDTGFDASGPSVSFKEVITSMNGPLFPLSASERAHSLSRSSKSVSTLKHHRRLDPLDVLLDSEATSWVPEERLRRRLDKAPPRDDNQPSGWSRKDSCTICRTNSSSSSISSPTSAISDNSDLSSFSSFTSSMTDITTPPVSPSSSSDVPLAHSLADAMQPLCLPPEFGLSSCRCIRPVSRLIAIDPFEDPLFVRPLPEKSKALSSPLPSPKLMSPQPLSKTRKASISSVSSLIITQSNSKLGQHVSRFIQLAKGFQNAYMHAMVYSVVPNCDDLYRDDSIQTSPKMKKMRLMPDGYRTSKEQVAEFICNLDSLESSSTPPTFISLGNGVDALQHTVLKQPFRYQTRLKRGLEPYISPFLRAHQQERVAKSRIRRNEPMLDLRDDSEFRRVISRSRSLSPHPELRKRIIENPLLVRMQALQGAVLERGGTWDAPMVRAGRLSCGKEKILVYTTAFISDSPLGIHR